MECERLRKLRSEKIRREEKKKRFAHQIIAECVYLPMMFYCFLFNIHKLKVQKKEEKWR